MYIQSASCISAQASFNKGPLLLKAFSGIKERLPLVEPDYTVLVDPKLIRRMSRIIRMGVATAMAHIELPAGGWAWRGSCLLAVIAR